jgi:hypothetical protein
LAFPALNANAKQTVLHNLNMQQKQKEDCATSHAIESPGIFEGNLGFSTREASVVQEQQ